MKKFEQLTLPDLRESFWLKVINDKNIEKNLTKDQREHLWDMFYRELLKRCSVVETI